LLSSGTTSSAAGPFAQDFHCLLSKHTIYSTAALFAYEQEHLPRDGPASEQTERLMTKWSCQRKKSAAADELVLLLSKLHGLLSISTICSATGVFSKHLNHLLSN